MDFEWSEENEDATEARFPVQFTSQTYDFREKKKQFVILPFLVFLTSRKIDSDCLSSQEKR